MKVLLLTADSNGAYPVPASKGGAVATLIEQLVESNSDKKCCDLYVLSFFEIEAYEKSKKYSNVSFMWVKVPKIIKKIDSIVFFAMKKIKGEQKAISYKTILSLLFYIWQAKKTIKKMKFEKIIIENNVPLACILKNSKVNDNCYYHFHNVPRISANCEEVFQKLKSIICVSKFVADKISSSNSAIGRIEISKTSILYNCVDTRLFRPIDKNDNKIMELREKYNLRLQDKILIYTGRLIPEKGVDQLLKAMDKLPDYVKTIIVGSYHYNSNISSEYQNKLKSYAQKLENRVIFTGYVNHNELPYLYNLADIAVLPSVWEEPAGLTNLEAMACGIPIITTNTGGVPEYVGESITLDIDGDLPNSISREVMRLLNDKELYNQKCIYGIKRTKEYFNKDDYLKNFMEIICK